MPIGDRPNPDLPPPGLSEEQVRELILDMTPPPALTEEEITNIVQAQLLNLRVRATKLLPGSEPTAAINPVTQTLTIGIPVGADGEDGADGKDGLSVTGVSVTPGPHDAPADATLSESGFLSLIVPKGKDGVDGQGIEEIVVEAASPEEPPTVNFDGGKLQLTVPQGMTGSVGGTGNPGADGESPGVWSILGAAAGGAGVVGGPLGLLVWRLARRATGIVNRPEETQENRNPEPKNPAPSPPPPPSSTQKGETKEQRKRRKDREAEYLKNIRQLNEALQHMQTQLTELRSREVRREIKEIPTSVADDKSWLDGNGGHADHDHSSGKIKYRQHYHTKEQKNRFVMYPDTDDWGEAYKEATARVAELHRRDPKAVHLLQQVESAAKQLYSGIRGRN